MAKAPKAEQTGNWVEGQLGDFKHVPGKERRTMLVVTVPFTRANCAALSVMIDYSVKIEEPDLGLIRPELKPLMASIENYKVKVSSKNQKGVRTKEIIVNLELPFSQEVSDGLFQIAEASPPALVMHQTQNEIQVTATEYHEEGEE